MGKIVSETDVCGSTTTRQHLLEINAERGNAGRRRREKRPKEPWKGEFVKSIVYAGLDAIVTCFSLISSINAGKLSSVDVLVLGFANLVADGISMGFGDYISTKTENDVAAKERALTEWDVTNHRSSLHANLIQKYQSLGMSEDDATAVVRIFAKYEAILVDEEMMTDKGMLPPEEQERPWKNGLVTFVSFIIFGSFPLLSFIILIPFTDDDTVKFIGMWLVWTNEVTKTTKGSTLVITQRLQPRSHSENQQGRIDAYVLHFEVDHAPYCLLLFLSI